MSEQEKAGVAPVRRKVIRKKVKNDEDEDIDSDDGKISAKKTGINWAAVFFLLLFILPMVIGAITTVADYFFPQAARQRSHRDRLIRCYSAANPKKVSEVDYLLKKYKGHEHILFAQLSNKYEKTPECHD
mmetsp:Transcript_5368/g.5533  ORF Transcript_5368/g.5533 Transcript_5368/m.5533 type:complete len:130 (+) Transcript_5368:160-549(+)